MNTKGFTLLETVIAAAAALVILSVVTVCTISLQRSFHFSEQTADIQNQTNRLIDYLDTDLRNATAISADGVPFRSGYFNLKKGSVLEIQRPNVYQSDDPTAAEYSNIRTLATTLQNGRNYVDYRNATDDSRTIRYTVETAPQTNVPCFVREENGVRQVLVTNAEGIDCDLNMSSLGQRVEIQTWFAPDSGNGTANVTSSGVATVRNPRRDL